MLVRDEWVKSTQFYPDSQRDVLQAVLTQADAALKRKELPVVIFDMDSTLFDVSKRSYEILSHWMRAQDAHTYAETVERLQGLQPNEMRYSLEDVWNARKIPLNQSPFDDHLKRAKGFWRKRFFSAEYMAHDAPMPGAVNFVKQLHERGAKIVYLTGRDVPLMAFGTFDQLHAHQLPIERERSRLILKPKRHLDDMDFKAKVALQAAEWGTVIANFENEPKNLLAMKNAFESIKQKPLNVFVESVCSDHPAPAGKDLYRIRDFTL